MSQSNYVQVESDSYTSPTAKIRFVKGDNIAIDPDTQYGGEFKENTLVEIYNEDKQITANIQDIIGNLLSLDIISDDNEIEVGDTVTEIGIYQKPNFHTSSTMHVYEGDDEIGITKFTNINSTEDRLSSIGNLGNLFDDSDGNKAGFYTNNATFIDTTPKDKGNLLDSIFSLPFLNNNDQIYNIDLDKFDVFIKKEENNQLSIQLKSKNS